MKISFRETKAFLQGGPYISPIPYPTSPMIPSIGDPYTYELINIRCPECKSEKGKKYADTDTVTCCGCNSRISLDSLDKSYSDMAITPQTLMDYMGGNTNNEQGGVFYHPESPNQDTWTGTNKGRLGN
jgi:hypothetical protein